MTTTDPTEARKILAAWDAAVAAHRAYWHCVDYGPRDPQTIADRCHADFEAVTAFMSVSGLRGPAGVALGG